MANEAILDSINDLTPLQLLMEKHRRQARSLEIFLSENLANVDSVRPRRSQGCPWRRGESQAYKQKLRTVVCSEALDKIIELKVVSRNLLIEIRAEYEKFIGALSQGHYQFNVIHGELKKSRTDPASLMSLERRGKELENRIALLQENNLQIENRIKKAKQPTSALFGEENSSKVQKDDNADDTLLVSNKPSFNEKLCHSVLDIMPVSAATDIGKLVQYSVKLQSKIQKLKESLRQQYANKSKLAQLKGQLLKKENIQYHLNFYNERLRERYENLRSASETFQKTEKIFERPPTISGIVNKALQDHRKASPDQVAFQNYAAMGTTEDDDPGKKQEAESLIEYMDMFNEMMSAKEYDQAARHAANSPKGVLRSYEIMKMFKDVDTDDCLVSPLLNFCEALMSTAKSTDKMSGGLSCEIIKGALKHGNLGLASYWISKRCLTHSLPLGNQLLDYCKCEGTCKCGSLDLAKEVFESMGAHRQASLCLLSTGKVHQLIQYGEVHSFSINDYVYLCRKFPSTKLLLFLMSAHIEDQIPGLISFPTAINILLSTENRTVLAKVLQAVYNDGLLEINGKRKTLTDVIFAETMRDDMSKSKWNQVVEFCTENSMEEIALELMSIFAVREAIDIATYKCLTDYIS